MLRLFNRLAADWKWHAAYLLLLLVAVVVLLMPGPRRPAQPAPDPGRTDAAPPAVAPVAPVNSPATDDLLDYTVQDNDTVASIARLFAVEPEALRAANGWAAGKELEPGMRIKIPPAAM